MFFNDIDKLIEQGRLTTAAKFLHQMEQIHPDDAKLAFTLADLYDRQDNWYESERYYRKTIRLDPTFVQAYTQLEQILREQARYPECREILDKVLAMVPSIEGPVKTSKAMLDMSEKGNLAKGLKAYENRFSFTHMKKAYEKEFFPRWTGRESLVGKSVLLRFEQGLGDTIQFSRYATVLSDLGASRVDILCKKPLHRILSSIDKVGQILDDPSDRVYDFEAMMMSIPALTNKTQAHQIPKYPYLFVSRKDSIDMHRSMEKTGKYNVGLVWAGDHKSGWQAERMNDRRSCPLEYFRPILDVDCDFYSLQKGEPENQLKDFHAAHRIKNVMGNVNDFYDTACIIDNLDLVIAVDTSTAHLAAAMGHKTWLMSRLDGDWRWLHERRDSPWYPSMEIFRQKEHAEWRPLINEIAGRLRVLVARG